MMMLIGGVLGFLLCAGVVCYLLRDFEVWH